MGAPAARVHELAKNWVREGHRVTVLTGFPNHPTGVIPSEYRKRFWRGVCHEYVEGIDVRRTWLLPLPNRRGYERMLNYSSFCFSALLRGIFLSKPDIIIATSPQLLVGLAGLLLSRAKRVPFIFEVRDLWPESLQAVGATSETSKLYSAVAAIAQLLYDHCDRLVVVTSAFKEHILTHWGVPAAKMSVVENGVETDYFSPTDVETAKRQLGWDSPFTVSYIGTIGMAHGLRTILDAAEKLQAQGSQVEFVIVGDGAEKEHLITNIQNRGLKNIRFVGQQSRDRVPAFIRASNVCLVLLKKAEVFKTVIPTKMLEFMSCGRPVILGVEGQAKQIVQAASAGICIEPENPYALVQAILELKGDPARCENLGVNGRKFILEQYSRRKTAETYMDVLQSCARA